MATTTAHDTQTARTLAVVQQVEEAVNRHDVEAVLALMTEDCVFENTFPAPDGTRHEGRAAVRTAFADLFRSSPRASFDREDCFACGERATVRWRYHWIDADGTPGHVRGTDILRLRDGKLVEMLSYVKG
ncbi:MAG TPA: nuclear transport factor 2 family protein [Thermomicrobiaceae bacterium]|nr:nuclear transport factor 2 family protein [Thermomicrobiaceae bacterium]